MFKKITNSSFFAHLVSAHKHYGFTYFVGNGGDGLQLAQSAGGLKWKALGDWTSYLKPEISKDKLMRDPWVIKGPDGKFHVVWTSGWHDHSLC